MFITKKRHEAEVKRIREEEEKYRLHDTKVYYTFYEQRIRDLQSQIEDLRKLVFPKTSSTPDPMVLEADSVLSGNQKPIEVSEEEHNRLLEQSREADLLISGNYSEDLLE